MNEYKIEYSYDQNGKRIHEIDVSANWTAQEAVDAVREEYSDLDGLKIERVYVDIDRRWEVRDCWE